MSLKVSKIKTGRLLLLGTLMMALSVPVSGSSNVQVTGISGTVLANGEEIQQNQSISSGVFINTPDDDTGFIDVNITENHKIRLQNPRLNVKSLEDEIKLDLQEGRLFSGTKKESETQQIRIATPQGIAGVRGTKFFLEANQEQTYVCVCEGSVWFQKHGLLNQLLGKTLTVPADHDAHIYSGEPVPEPELNPRMVRRTWKVFKSMGFDVPQKFRN